MSQSTIPRWYRKWSSMLQRCYNPNHPAFKYYGGRGIQVCPQWRLNGGAKQFLQDMGEPPEGLTLERKDSSKDYSPDNCRWATWKEQAANRRQRGPAKPDSLRQQALKAGLSYSVVYQRVKIHGWPLERALSTPKRPKHGSILFKD